MEIQRTLGRIEGKQDAMIQSQQALQTNYQTLRGDVDKLKMKLNWYSGCIAALSAAGLFFKDKVLGALFG